MEKIIISTEVDTVHVPKGFTKINYSNGEFEIIPTDSLSEETADKTDEETFSGEMGLYKMLQPIPFTDEDGNTLGETEVGSIQNVPKELGDSWIDLGWAELFIPEDNPEPTQEKKTVKKTAKKK
jgi:hypothetical protein